MITPTQAAAKFGQPGKAEGTYMTIWNVPKDIVAAFSHVQFTALGKMGFPSKIYLNKYIKTPLEQALRNLIAKRLHKEMRSWDGCYVIRNTRGLSAWSLHAWGLAVDVNAASNRLGHTPALSKGFIKCFTDAGFDWGGLWRRPDGMHFQLAAFNKG
ncbi:MAG: M15 family metallopeptidase [Chitinophagaceae bacterium]